MEDEQIVALYWARSERAIRESMAKYGAYCQAIACNILSFRADAEEAVNDTWLGAWNAMPPARPAVLRTFLGKITRRVSLKRLRDLYREKRGGGQVALALEELDECVSGGSTPEQAVSEQELGEALRRFVDGLPQTERRVFLCRYWYLEPITVISQSFGFSESKIKSMLSRSRRKLQAYLRKENFL